MAFKILGWEAVPKTCSISECYGKHEAKGYCVKHYARLRRHGDINKIINITGIKRSTKTKQLQSKLKKEYYKNGGNSPMLGKHHSEESNEKNRISHYNIKPSNKIYYNTKPERFLQSILSVNGIKYETHKTLYGQPDIFIEPNICVFVDGNYWHTLPEKIQRDNRVNSKLILDNFKVIRLWEKEIYNEPMICFNKIKMEINNG